MRNLTVVLVVLALAGCDGSSSGATAAQVRELQALQQQVTDLQTQVATLQHSAAPAVFIRAPNAPAVKLAPRASDKITAFATSAASTCTGLGTLTGRPSDSDPIKSDNVSGVSCAGFYFTVSGGAASTATALVQPLQSALAVWFDSPNCTGSAYVSVANGSAQSLSSGALANGAVFRAYAAVNDPTDVSSYWMLKPGTAKVAPLLLSYLQGLQCSATSLSFDVYQLEPNDPTVSGVPSAPIPGPVTIS